MKLKKTLPTWTIAIAAFSFISLLSSCCYQPKRYPFNCPCFERNPATCRDTYYRNYYESAPNY